MIHHLRPAVVNKALKIQVSCPLYAIPRATLAAGVIHILQKKVLWEIDQHYEKVRSRGNLFSDDAKQFLNSTNLESHGHAVKKIDTIILNHKISELLIHLERKYMYLQHMKPIKYMYLQHMKPIKYMYLQHMKPIKYMYLQHMKPIKNVIASVCITITEYLEYLETQCKRNTVSKK